MWDQYGFHQQPFLNKKAHVELMLILLVWTTTGKLVSEDRFRFRCLSSATATSQNLVK